MENLKEQVKEYADDIYFFDDIYNEMSKECINNAYENAEEGYFSDKDEFMKDTEEEIKDNLKTALLEKCYEEFSDADEKELKEAVKSVIEEYSEQIRDTIEEECSDIDEVIENANEKEYDDE